MKIQKIKNWIAHHKFMGQLKRAKKNMEKLGMSKSSLNKWEYNILVAKGYKKAEKSVDDMVNDALKKYERSQTSIMFTSRRAPRGVMCRINDKTAFLYKDFIKTKNDDWLDSELDSEPTDLIEEEE